MTTAMEDVTYEKKNFNCDWQENRHPLWITERHFIYHLVYDEVSGKLVTSKDALGSPVKSCRRLTEICMYSLVCEGQVLQKSKGVMIASNLYPSMLSEAIYQREGPAVVWLVSTWPSKTMRVFDLVPLEDYLEKSYLTMSFEGNESMTVLDCIILGLLKLKPEARLRYVDFTGFDKDRKLSRELSRLPILWMKPENRTLEKIHDYMSETIDLTKDKAQRFLNRISVVYDNIDGEFKHENKISNITIILDLKIHLDDVPIGLSLSRHSPFKFACQRLWMKPIPEVWMPPDNITQVLNIKRITHFEYEDPALPMEEAKFESLMEAIGSMKFLVGLSLPSSIDVNLNKDMAAQMNKVLQKLRYLQRLNLSYCNLRGHVKILLKDCRFHACYLNLRDCRLVEEDLMSLFDWRAIVYLRELNLSCNNLQNYEQFILYLMERMKKLTCLNLSCCSLTIHTQCLVAKQCKECSRLKVLSIQGYAPLPQEEMLEMIYVLCQVRTLQKITLLPDAFGFHGNNDEERQANKYHMMCLVYKYLEMRSRDDIEVE